jgi:predicted anti-sigma-YlaC factor YlaD
MMTQFDPPHESTTTRLAQQEFGECVLIQDLLPLYLDNEVSEGSRAMIAEHLSRCERCAGFLAGARSMRMQLRGEGSLRQERAAHDVATRQAVALGRRRLMWLTLGGFAAVVAMGFLMVVFGLFWSGARMEEPRAIYSEMTATPVPFDAGGFVEMMPTAFPPTVVPPDGAQLPTATPALAP